MSEPWPPGVSDPFGRNLEAVRRDAELAQRATELVDEAVAQGQQLRLEREAGPRLWRRLEASRDAFARMAARDVTIAEQVELYERDELDWPAAVEAGMLLVRKR